MHLAEPPPGAILLGGRQGYNVSTPQECTHSHVVASSRADVDLLSISI